MESESVKRDHIGTWHDDHSMHWVNECCVFYFIYYHILHESDQLHNCFSLFYVLRVLISSAICLATHPWTTQHQLLWNTATKTNLQLLILMGDVVSTTQHKARQTGLSWGEHFCHKYFLFFHAKAWEKIKIIVYFVRQSVFLCLSTIRGGISVYNTVAWVQPFWVGH